MRALTVVMVIVATPVAKSRPAWKQTWPEKISLIWRGLLSPRDVATLPSWHVEQLLREQVGLKFILWGSGVRGLVFHNTVILGDDQIVSAWAESNERRCDLRTTCFLRRECGLRSSRLGVPFGRSLGRLLVALSIGSKYVTFIMIMMSNTSEAKLSGRITSQNANFLGAQFQLCHLSVTRCVALPELNPLYELLSTFLMSNEDMDQLQRG